MASPSGPGLPRPSDRSRLAHCCLPSGAGQKAHGLCQGRAGSGEPALPTGIISLALGGETAHAELPGLRRHTHNTHPHRPLTDTQLHIPTLTQAQRHAPSHRHRDTHLLPRVPLPTPAAAPPHPQHRQAAGSWLWFPRKRCHHHGTAVSGAPSMFWTSLQSLPETQAAGGHAGCRDACWAEGVGVGRLGTTPESVAGAGTDHPHQSPDELRLCHPRS